MNKNRLNIGDFRKNLWSIVVIFVVGFSVGAFCITNYQGISFDRHIVGKTTEYGIIKIDTCFSPGGSCGDLICKHLDAAKDEILVQAYSFTSKKIAESLVKAKARGVVVSVMVDRSAAKTKGSMLWLLLQNQIKISYDKVSGLAHNKIMIIDKSRVITGSYNFTSAADNRNSENLLIIDNKDIAKKYLDNWDVRKKSSRIFKY
jgi:phospholipase D